MYNRRGTFNSSVAQTQYIAVGEQLSIAMAMCITGGEHSSVSETQYVAWGEHMSIAMAQEPHPPVLVHDHRIPN